MEHYDKRYSLRSPAGSRYVYIYKVTGRGYFPMDMLRYDSARPSGSEDASAMGSIRGAADKQRTVELVGARPPTVARWASFGWKVEERDD